MNKTQILSEIQLYLDAVGYQLQTKKAIIRGIGEFLEWLTSKEIATLQATRLAHIKSYHEYLKQRPNRIFGGGLSPKMIKDLLWHVSILFNYQERQGSIDRNPMSGYRQPRPTGDKRSILSREQIQALYQSSKTPKDRLVLALFYGLGLRRSEGVALNLEDVDLKNGLIFIRKSKQKSSRKLPLNPRLIQDFKDYLAKRPPSKSKALALNLKGNRMRGKSYLAILRRLLDRANLPSSIDLHCLRHSIASHLIESGMALEQVRIFLGHRHLESTQNYIHYGHQNLSV